MSMNIEAKWQRATTHIKAAGPFLLKTPSGHVQNYYDISLNTLILGGGACFGALEELNLFTQPLQNMDLPKLARKISQYSCNPKWKICTF